MKKESVRCWKMGKNNEHVITYPEGDKGHKLICCKYCGEVYAVNIIKQIYIEPDLDRQLNNMNCLKCGAALAGHWLDYPDNYIDKNGSICSFYRPEIIPEKESSLILDLYEVYS